MNRISPELIRALDAQRRRANAIYVWAFIQRVMAQTRARA